MTVGALSGFTVAVTADRRREEQGELLERRGATVFFGPVIRTLPLDDEERLRDATEQLVEEPPDLLVLTTALGVRGWFEAASALGIDAKLLDALEGVEILARGPKAAGAAMTAGLDVTWITPQATAREIIDALTERLAERDHPRRVAVQLDGAESTPLPEELAALGYDVVGVPVYRWELPDDLSLAHRLITAVADRSVDAVTFTSGHAVSNFVRIATDLDRMDDVIGAFESGVVSVVAVGPVTAARCRDLGLGEPVQPVHPRLGAMVQALAASFGGRTLAFDLAGTPVLVQGRLVALGDDEPVSLTDRERAVLAVLADRPGAVVSKHTLLKRVWAGETDEHVVEVTIGRLRRRLGPAGEGIETVMRRGYRLTPV